MDRIVIIHTTPKSRDNLEDLMKDKTTILFEEPKNGKKNAKYLSSDYQTSNESQIRDALREDTSKKLDSLAKRSARILLDIKAVFPFNFFPDEIIIDETKVSIHTKFFFYSKQVRGIDYADIFNVVIQQGIFFAKLEIIDRFFSEQTIVVEYLWKRDAVRARRIIQGMMIAKKENIDTQLLPLDELLKKLDRIGQSR